MEQFLLEKIEALRARMLLAASLRGNLAHDEVLAISRDLDRCIVIYQRLTAKRIRLKRMNRGRPARASYIPFTSEKFINFI